MISTANITWFSISIMISLIISFRGYQKQSLSLDGAIASFIIGTLTFYSSFIVGFVLILFFITSSMITKMGAKRKETIEEDFRVGGQRNTIQVLSNSMGANICMIILCLYSMTQDDLLQYPWLYRALILASISHYACCCADTWSSELGSLSKQEPVLITSLFNRDNLEAIIQGKFDLIALQPVPAGTNGGVSLDGTIAGIAGGLVIGAGSSVLVWVSRSFMTWYVTPTTCLMYGFIFGALGTFLDSLLGAALQFSGMDETGRIVSSPSRGKGHTITHITGRNILTNDQVNLVTSLIITFMAFVCALIF